MPGDSDSKRRGKRKRGWGLIPNADSKNARPKPFTEIDIIGAVLNFNEIGHFLNNDLSCTLVLYQLYGNKVEVAEILRCDEGTVRNRLDEAILCCRKFVNDSDMVKRYAPPQPPDKQDIA